MTKTRVLTLILIILTGITSCKKTPEKIGKDLQPTNSLITVAFDDARDIVSSTFTVPSLSTKMLGYTFLGNNNDPIFGISNFDFYTQLSLTTESQTWGEGAVADSVVLNLVYNGYYGDTTEYMTVRAYEILEEMYADSTYSSNMVLECDDTELANHIFRPYPHTSPDTVLDRGVLRIPINPSLGTKFIENEAELVSNTKFKEFFKGLHVQCDITNAEGAICYFNMIHSYTYLRVYYHNAIDTLHYDFSVTSTDVRFNHYYHDFNAAASPITFNDTVNNAKLYVQGTAGTRVWVCFPHLQEWANSLDGNVAINEAKLILSGAVTDTTRYIPPVKLVAAGAKFSTDTTYVILPDQFVGSEYFGGSYDKTDATVFFRITEYVQNVIKNGAYATNCDGLLIYVDQGSYTPRRWAFHGPQSDSLDKRVRLEVVYSLIND